MLEDKDQGWDMPGQGPPPPPFFPQCMFHSRCNGFQQFELTAGQWDPVEME